MNDELKDVAKGSIVQPANRIFHSKPMAPDMRRVKYSMVLLGYEAGAGRDGEPAPRRGWHALCLEDAELGTWIARLLPLAGDVIVVSPPPLREAILERLATAATWGGRHA